MAVDNRLDFFRMHFLAADIDDSTTTAGKEIAVAAAHHDVARINEAIGIAQDQRLADIAARGPRRAYAQRVIDDLHGDATESLVDIGSGESLLPVVDLEADARLGRGIGVADLRVRILPLKRIEDRLVRDFAGQAHVARRKGRRSRIHQYAPPMRRRS